MFSKDIKLILHEKRTLWLALILTAAVIAAVAFGSKAFSSPRISMGVCDMDRSEYSVMLVSYFKENKVFNSYIDLVEGDEKGLKERFARGELDLYLVIPPDFAGNLININNVAMKAVINSSNETKAVVYKNLLESYAKYISAVEVNCQSLYELMEEEGFSREYTDRENVAVSLDLVFTALGKDAFFERTYLDRFEGISLVNYYIYSIQVLLVMYTGLFAGLSHLKERLGSVHLRLETIGRGKASFVLSKAGAFTLVFGGMLAAAFAVIGLFSELELGVLPALLAIASLFVISIAFVLISNCFKSESGYIIFANMLVLLLTIAGGGIIPVMYLPEVLAKIARLTPNYWFIRALL